MQANIDAGQRYLSIANDTKRAVVTLGARMRELAIRCEGRDLLATLFGEGCVVSQMIDSIFSSADQTLLLHMGLTDKSNGNWSSPFCVHFVDDLLIFTDPDLPQAERPTSYVDPFWGSKILTRVLVRGKVATVLDMGCGAGILALTMSRYAENVVGIDLNPRAISLSKFNATINDVQNVRFEHGDLYAPVQSKRFDRIVFNTPSFSRDGTDQNILNQGETVLQRFLTGLDEHLTRDGYCQLCCLMQDFPSSRFEDRFMRWLGQDFQVVVVDYGQEDLSALMAARCGWFTIRRGERHFMEFFQPPSLGYSGPLEQLPIDLFANFVISEMDKSGA